MIRPLVAESDEDATALFRAAARPGVVRVDRPVHADRFGESLVEAGLVGHEISAEMVRGDWPRIERAESLSAMASHAWG